MRRNGNDVVQWLLNGDAAIRWQVFRDLLGSPDSVVRREQRKVGHEGWGARLLALQDRQGTWGGGLYNPKWTSTTYTMLLLRDLGVPRSEQTEKACALMLDRGFRADGGVNFGADQSETCITGMTLSIVSYFEYDDGRLDTIADHVLHQQMPDGGWNCRRRFGATHSSVHTTINVLEGLRRYELHRRHRVQEVRAAQRRAREFLLVHQLFRSHRSGRTIKPEFKRFAFPPRWHYDILRSLDYFQTVGASRDARLAEAMDIVARRRRADGRWVLDNCYRGKSFFDMERRGWPSRWNTLRALRVLKWWQGEKAPRM